MKSLGARTTKAARVTLTLKKKSKAQTGSRSRSKEMAARKAGSVPPAEPASIRFQDVARKIESDYSVNPPFQKLAKEPSSAKYAAMAGAMYNALERLRVFYQTMANLAASEHKDDQGWSLVVLHPSERKALLGELTAAANILRAGLKARNAK